MHPTARTAITRKGPSAPVKALWKEGLIKGPVLDFGSGRGEDARWLRRKGVKVDAYDPHHGPAKLPDRKYATVLATYVHCVLPRAQQAKATKEIRSRLRDGGRGLITVRTDTCPTPPGGVQECVNLTAPIAVRGSGFQTFEVRRAGSGQRAKRPSPRERVVEVPAPFDDLYFTYELMPAQVYEDLIHSFRAGGYVPTHRSMSFWKDGTVGRLPVPPDEMVLNIPFIRIPPRRAGVGWGKRFVQAAERWAASQGARLSLLEAVGYQVTTHGHARDFWEAIGYATILEGDDDNAIMAKWIAPRPSTQRTGHRAKHIGSRSWVHRSALSELPPWVQRRVKKLGGRPDLIRFDKATNSIMLGWAPGLGREAVPCLERSELYRPGQPVLRKSYEGDSRPVYHRTELMFAPSDPRRPALARKSRALEKRGLLSRRDIGTRGAWKRASMRKNQRWS